MPRLVFTNKEEFLNWVTDHVTPSQFEAFVTDDAELVIAPTKSTKTLRYAYISIYDCWDTPDLAVKDLQKRVPKIKVYRIKKFDWDPTRSVGVKQLP